MSEEHKNNRVKYIIFMEGIADVFETDYNIYSEDITRRIKFLLGIKPSLLNFMVIAFYAIHNKGYSAFDESTEKFTLRAPCISCNIQKAMHMCECHRKEYCSQDCANKDHLYC